MRKSIGIRIGPSLDDLAAEYPPAEQEVVADFLRNAAERTRAFMATLDADTLPT